MAEPITSQVDSPALLVRGAAGLALLGTVIAVVDHIGLSLPSADGWLAIPGSAWGWAAVHLVGGLASLHIGYLLLTRAYPLRDLAAQGATNPAAAVQLTAHRLAAAALSRGDGRWHRGCGQPLERGDRLEQANLDSPLGSARAAPEHLAPSAAGASPENPLAGITQP